MTWTPPNTWQTNDEITAQLLNETRDNLLSVAHVLDTQIAQVNVVNSALETYIYSVLVPGGSLGTSGKLTLLIGGTKRQGVSTSGGNNFFRVKLGGGTVAYSQSGSGSSEGSEVPWSYLIHGFNNSSESAQIWMGQSFIGGVSGLGSHFLGTSAIDTSVDQTFGITFQWTSADPTLILRRELAYLTLAQN